MQAAIEILSELYPSGYTLLGEDEVYTNELRVQLLQTLLNSVESDYIQKNVNLPRQILKTAAIIRLGTTLGYIDEEVLAFANQHLKNLIVE